MSIVRVLESFVGVVDGVPTSFRQGEPYDSEDPIVALFPGSFAADNVARDSSVEQATAAPGERRNVARK